jgi:protein-S-isoprenylcysteine O-methyltransferase Ste14
VIACGAQETAAPEPAPNSMSSSRPVARGLSPVVVSHEIRELVAKVTLGSLMLVFAYSIWLDFASTGRWTGTLMLVSELMVVALTIVRRRPIEVDRGWDARLVTFVSVMAPPLLRPVSGGGLASDLVTVAVSSAGLALIISGKWSLGRSFGLMPANRGIVSSGLYRVLRHPIYAGYLVCHVGFLIAHPTLRNLTLLIAADCALLVRSLYEERTLRHDEHYVRYCDAVRWRVLPGVF